MTMPIIILERVQIRYFDIYTKFTLFPWKNQRGFRKSVRVFKKSFHVTEQSCQRVLRKSCRRIRVSSTNGRPTSLLLYLTSTTTNTTTAKTDMSAAIWDDRLSTTLCRCADDFFQTTCWLYGWSRENFCQTRVDFFGADVDLCSGTLVVDFRWPRRLTNVVSFSGHVTTFSGHVTNFSW